MSDLQLHQPSLDDVFLEKTGRSLEGAGRRGRGRRGRPSAEVAGVTTSPRRVARARPADAARAGRLIARRSISRTLRQPALVIPVILFPLILLAVNAAGLELGDAAAGLPDGQLHQLRDRRLLRAGRAVRPITAGTELATDIQKGFLDRLALTPARRWTVLLGTLAGGVSVSVWARSLPRRRPDLRRPHRVRAARRGGAVALAIYIAIAFAGIGAWLAIQTGSPRRCRACSRCCSSSSSSRR